jgi:apolipoprotein N-acyltransferase
MPTPRSATLPATTLAALLALGAVHALSFAPGPLPHWSLPFVQLFALAVLAWHAMRAATAWRAALTGFVFGLAHFAVGLYWLYISMHEYGGISAPLAVLAVLLLSAFLALYTGLATGAASLLGGRYLPQATHYRRQLLAAAAWASCWAGAEWLRGTLFTGLPWLNIGYAHVEGMLAGWAPVVGVYGIAWLAAFAAAAIALLACAKDTQNDARTAIGVGLAVLSGLAGIFLGHVSWSSPHGEPLLVRLTQGNVPQSQKFDASMFVQAQMDYLELASLPPRDPKAVPDLVVMPETVVPLFQDNVAPNLWEHWLNVARPRWDDSTISRVSWQACAHAAKPCAIRAEVTNFCGHRPMASSRRPRPCRVRSFSRRISCLSIGLQI